MNLRSVRPALLTGLLGLLPSLAAAQQQLPPPDPALLQLDQTVQRLRQEVLRFNSQAQSVEDDLLYPPETRASIYLGVQVSQLLVDTVTLRLDQRPPVTHQLSDAEARALLTGGGLQRLMRANLDPGEHTLEIEVRGRFADAREDAPPFEAQYRTQISKGLSPVDVQLQLSRKGRRNAPELEARLLRAARS